MKLIQVWIEGTNPLIQNRFTENAEVSVSKGTRKVAMRYELPRVQAEQKVYRDEKTQHLTMPGAAISRLLRESGGAHKQKGSRKSVKYIVPAAVRVGEEWIELFDKDRKKHKTDFEVDSRSVVIRATQGRIMAHRPRHDTWSAKFTLRINDDILDPELVRQLLNEGGMGIGVGDFRPEKGGPFGTFDVVSWIDITIPVKKK